MSPCNVFNGCTTYFYVKGQKFKIMQPLGCSSCLQFMSPHASYAGRVGHILYQNQTVARKDTRNTAAYVQHTSLSSGVWIMFIVDDVHLRGCCIMFTINNVVYGLVPSIVFGEVSSYMVNSNFETTSSNKNIIGVLVCYRLTEEGEDLWGFRPSK